MTEAKDTTPPKRGGWRRWALFGLPVAGVATAFAAGIIFWGGFNTAMEATNTLGFCISCHEMESTVYQEYKTTVHYENRTGVRAVCSDCHVPHDWTHKIIRKVQASKEVWGKITGSINTPEKFDAKRLELAMHEWDRMKATDSRECRNCHGFESMLPEKQRPRARQQHMNALETGQTCIDCHKGIAHHQLRDRMSEEELEALEAPNPAFARGVPDSFRESLARIEAKEADDAAAAEAAAKASADAVTARVTSAVEAARAEEQAKAEAALAAALAAASGAPEMAPAATEPAAEPAAAATGNAGEAVAADVDWNAIAPQSVRLFYPGQASFEWVQNGKGHGGARPFTKGGDRCSTCHAKELADMGQKIVTGTKLEPTPIAGKPAYLDLALQATHDAENLYLRLQWQGGPHTPVPFVDGGKMDPDHQAKIAMMIAGTGIDKVDQAGCWATCHNDNRYMPDAPDGAALGASAEAAARLGATDQGMGGVTKYLAESRTEIELKGKGGKPLGGWDKPKAEAEIETLLAGGTYMDVLRAGSGGLSQNGHILDHRVPEGNGAIRTEVTQDGDNWTAIIVRPLNTGAAGDVVLEPGKTYTVGFAIHDDYTAARFHHVSLEYHLGFDDPAADINVTGR